MKRRIYSLAILAGLAALTLTTPSQASVVPSSPVNGLTTFTDTNTGWVWVRLDNFFDKDYYDMATIVQAAGFKVANVNEVRALLDSLPLDSTGTNWDSYAAVMGSAPNRALIWGGFLPEPGNPQFDGWAFSFRVDTFWSVFPSADDIYNVPNAGSDVADLNIWAFQSGSPVPEPGALAFFASLGVAGAIFLRRKRAR